MDCFFTQTGTFGDSTYIYARLFHPGGDPVQTFDFPFGKAFRLSFDQTFQFGGIIQILTEMKQ